MCIRDSWTAKWEQLRKKLKTRFYIYRIYHRQQSLSVRMKMTTWKSENGESQELLTLNTKRIGMWDRIWTFLILKEQPKLPVQDLLYIKALEQGLSVHLLTLC